MHSHSTSTRNLFLSFKFSHSGNCFHFFLCRYHCASPLCVTSQNYVNLLLEESHCCASPLYLFSGDLVTVLQPALNFLHISLLLLLGSFASSLLAQRNPTGWNGKENLISCTNSHLCVNCAVGS